MQAVDAWRATPSDATAAEVHAASEPRRQELFRRLNLAPGGTAALVRMREQLMDALDHRDDLRAVDDDFVHLFSSWFNRGFLVLRRIDWSTPAIVLEKIIRYEAVHEIRDWDDLRRRIDPPDRRCFAFFHPALVDEPLIFVEVALDARYSRRDRADPRQGPRDRRSRQGAHRGVLFDLELPARARRRLLRQFPDQAGGRGGQPRDCRGCTTFVTLSPVPNFARLAQARTRRREIRRADRGRQGRACRCSISPAGGTIRRRQRSCKIR